MLTGPIYVEGAEPGDMLEVRVLHIDFRAPYGVSNSNKGSGRAARAARQACIRRSSSSTSSAASRCSRRASRFRCRRSWASWR